MPSSIFSRFPRPPISDLLGWELIAEDPAAGTVEIAFAATAAMLNPRGTVQGGMVAAMLDDTMGPALASMTGGRIVPATADLTVSFLRPVHPGRLTGRGRVVKLGKAVVFLEAELFDEAGALLARATSTGVPTEIAPPE